MQHHIYRYGRRHGNRARPARSTYSLFVDQLPDGRWAQWWARDWYVVDQEVWQRRGVIGGANWIRLDPATGLVMT
jgi:hypothetical protein